MDAPSAPLHLSASRRRKCSQFQALVPVLAAGGLAFAFLATSCASLPGRADPALSLARGQPASAIGPLKRQLEKNPDDLEALRLLGEAHRQLGQYPDAAAVLRRATRLDSRDAPTWAALGEVLVRLGEGQEAAAAFHAAVSNNRTDPRYQQRLQEVLEGLGMYEQLVAAVRELMVTGPQDAPRLNALAVRYREMNQPRAAADALRASLELDPAQPGLHGLLGLTLLDCGAYSDAVEALQRAENEEPGEARYSQAKGQALYQLRKYPEAAAAFERAARVAGGVQPEAIAGQALSLHAQGRSADARRLLDQALRRVPSSAALQLAAARVALDGKQWPTAQKRIDRALKIAPTSYEPHLLSGMLHLQQGRLPRAEAALNEALRLGPDKPEVLVQLAELKRRSGKTVEALPLVQQALKIDKVYVPALVLQGELQDWAGNLSQAQATCEKLRRRDPTNPQWLYRGGDLALRLQDPGEAQQVADAMVERFPKLGLTSLLVARTAAAQGDFSAANRQLAQAKARLNRSAELQRGVAEVALLQQDIPGAVTALRQAVRLEPTHAPTRLLLGEALLRGGDERGAQQELAAVIQLDPDSAAAAKAGALLKPATEAAP